MFHIFVSHVCFAYLFCMLFHIFVSNISFTYLFCFCKAMLPLPIYKANNRILDLSSNKRCWCLDALTWCSLFLIPTRFEHTCKVRRIPFSLSQDYTYLFHIYLFQMFVWYICFTYLFCIFISHICSRYLFHILVSHIGFPNMFQIFVSHV